MNQTVIKYIGRFGGAEANGVPFPKNVPIPVSKALADQLLAQPDFVKSSMEELVAHESGRPAAVTAPAPAPTAQAAPANKE